MALSALESSPVCRSFSNNKLWIHAIYSNAQALHSFIGRLRTKSELVRGGNTLISARSCHNRLMCGNQIRSPTSSSRGIQPWLAIKCFHGLLHQFIGTIVCSCTCHLSFRYIAGAAEARVSVLSMLSGRHFFRR